MKKQGSNNFVVRKIKNVWLHKFSYILFIDVDSVWHPIEQKCVPASRNVPTCSCDGSLPDYSYINIAPEPSTVVTSIFTTPFYKPLVVDVITQPQTTETPIPGK